MEKNLHHLLKNKISKSFIVNLEEKLLSQYEAGTGSERFVLLRYSLAGLGIMVLAIVSVIFAHPFYSRNNIVANALEYYRTLEEAPGILYAKYRIGISGQEGLETQFGNEYIEKSWVGDNGERLLEIEGSKDGIMLTTGYGRSFSNNPLDNHSPSMAISCAINEQQEGNLIGRTMLKVEAGDYSRYQIFSEIQEDSTKNLLELSPEEEWQSNGKMPWEVLAGIQQDSRFKVEAVMIEENEGFKVTTERDEDVMEMYFEKDTLALKRVISYPKEHPEFKFSTEYLEVKNVTDVSADELFSPEKHRLQEVYEDTPFLEEGGCYFPNGKKMREEETNQLLLSLPDSAKQEIDSSGSLIKDRLRTSG